MDMQSGAQISLPNIFNSCIIPTSPLSFSGPLTEIWLSLGCFAEQSLCLYSYLMAHFKTSSALHVVGCSFHRKYTEIDVMAVGLWAEGRPVKVTLYQHLAQGKGKYCLELIFLKIPWHFLEWSLGGGRSNCEPGRTTSTLQSLGAACAVVVFVRAGERFPNPVWYKSAKAFLWWPTESSFSLNISQRGTDKQRNGS